MRTLLLLEDLSWVVGGPVRGAARVRAFEWPGEECTVSMMKMDTKGYQGMAGDDTNQETIKHDVHQVRKGLTTDGYLQWSCGMRREIANEAQLEVIYLSVSDG